MARFLVTEECGRLARWLRLCGYDAVTATAKPFGTLYRRAYNEGRIIVTRNRRLTPGRLVRVVQVSGQRLEEQLRQLRQELRLAIDIEQVFTRCDRCNVLVEPLAKARAKDRVPPRVWETQERFYACPSCGRVYWAASHWRRVKAFLEAVG